MAFNKIVSLKLSKPSGAIVMDNLSVGFRIYRSNKLTMNTAEFNIRNLNDDTVASFLDSGTTIEFSAGWEDQNGGVPSVIFIGNVLRQAEVKRENVDRMFNIFSGSMANLMGINEKKLADAAQAASESLSRQQADPAVKKAVRDFAKAERARMLDADTFAYRINCSLSYQKDTALASILRDLFVGILGLNLNGLDLIANMKLPSPFVFQGSVHLATKKLSNILRTSGLGLFIDNTDCRVFDRWSPKTLHSVGYLSWTSGLVSLGELIDYTEDLSAQEDKAPRKTLKLTCLLQPEFQPNGVVRIDTPDNPSTNGNFLIESVEFYGDNQEGEFLCDCVVSEYSAEVLP